MAFYSCAYTYVDGRICGKKMLSQEGCHIHWKRQSRIPCGECDTPTASSYGMCTKHAEKYYSKANYYKNKLPSPATYSPPDNSLYSFDMMKIWVENYLTNQ